MPSDSSWYAQIMRRLCSGHDLIGSSSLLVKGLIWVVTGEPVAGLRPSRETSLARAQW